MKVTDLPLEGLKLIEPDVFGDDRGFFMETWQAERYREHGIDSDFVQDNISRSTKGVLRGLHFQQPHPQGKLVHCLDGEIFDVAVDIRRDSPTFGKWHAEILSSENHHQYWIPPGFAHGFCVLSNICLVAYKCTDRYQAEADRAVLWNDPDIGIEWPQTGTEPIISAKDTVAPGLHALSEQSLPE